MDDFLEICAGLSLQDATFVSHSVSGMSCLRDGIEQLDRFERLVMAGPSPRYIDDGEYVGGFSRQDINELLEFQDSYCLGWASSLGRSIMGNAELPELAAGLTNSFCSSSRLSTIVRTETR